MEAAQLRLAAVAVAALAAGSSRRGATVTPAAQVAASRQLGVVVAAVIASRLLQATVVAVLAVTRSRHEVGDRERGDWLPANHEWDGVAG